MADTSRRNRHVPDPLAKAQTARLGRTSYASNWGIKDTLTEWARFAGKLLVILILVGAVIGGWWLFRYTQDNAKRLDEAQKTKQEQASGESVRPATP